MYLKPISRLCTMCILTIAAVLAFSTQGMAQAYQQTNLVSDIQGLAPTPDGHLLNPWSDFKFHQSLVGVRQQRRCIDFV